MSLGLEGDDIILPNYAFTQINPLPFEVPPVVTITMWGYEINALYVLGLYMVYVAIFFAFYILSRLFLLLHRAALGKRAAYEEADGIYDPADGLDDPADDYVADDYAAADDER